jgi:serine/threonine-protein kinase
VTAAADIYSLGIVGYELLTGETPYRVDTLADLAAEQRRPPPPLEDVPPQLDSALRRCLAVEPAARPASAGRLARELAAGSPEPPTVPLPRAEVTAATEILAPPPSRASIHLSRRVLIALAVLAGIAVFVTSFAIAASRGDGSSQPPPQPPPPAQPAAQPELVPRGDTAAESARLLAQWLRDRAG